MSELNKMLGSMNLYWKMEKLKQKGWELVGNKSVDPVHRVCGLLMVISSHYDRCIFDLMTLTARQRRKMFDFITDKNVIPSFDLYVRHWLHANGDRVKEQDVVEALIDTGYEPEQSIHLPKGMSMYLPLKRLGK